MFNDMMELLSDVPLTLAAGWAVWFVAGALLAMWYRRAQADLEMPPAVATRTVARAKSGPRPTAITELRLTQNPGLPRRSHWRRRPVAVAAPRPKPAPVVVGDPFGDLATLLDQPAASPAPVSRAAQ